MFSAFGPVQKIAMFDKNGGLQALIQYPGIFGLLFHSIVSWEGSFCDVQVMVLSVFYPLGTLILPALSIQLEYD